MARSGQDPFSRLREAHRNLQRHMNAMMTSPTYGQGTWSPPMDVYRTGDSLVVRAEVPGVDQQSIHVDYTGTSLRISGERKEEPDERKQGYYLMEIDYGPFFREIPLPTGAQGDRIQAVYRNGFLIITVPLSTAGPKGGVEISVQ